jgi:hypothetical protein
MWEHIIEPDRPQMTVWRMRFPCRITKAANTQSEYVMLFSYRLQQWLHERALLLRYTNIALSSKVFHSPTDALFINPR